MRFCPVQDRNGRCSRFVDYMLGALIRHGINQQYDLEDALQRIVFWMLSPVGERDLPRTACSISTRTAPMTSVSAIRFKRFFATI